MEPIENELIDEYKDLRDAVDEAISLITVTPEGLAQSKERAGRFLTAQALLSNYQLEISQEIAKLITLRDVVFAKVSNSAEGSNITQKKINAEANPEYSAAREQLENAEARRDWMKTNSKLFENAHILFRAMER